METVEGGGSTSKNPLLHKRSSLGSICLRGKKGLIWFFFKKNKPCIILTCLFSFFSSSTIGLTTTALSHSGNHWSGTGNYTAMKIFKLNIEKKKKEVSIPFCVNSVTHTPLEGISGHLWFGSNS